MANVNAQVPFNLQGSSDTDNQSQHSTDIDIPAYARRPAYLSPPHSLFGDSVADFEPHAPANLKVHLIDNEVPRIYDDSALQSGQPRRSSDVYTLSEEVCWNCRIFPLF